MIVWRWLQFEWIKLKIISKLLIEYHKGADMRWQYEEGMYSLVYYFLGAGWDYFCKVFFLIFCKISPNKRDVCMFGSFFKIQKQIVKRIFGALKGNGKWRFKMIMTFPIKSSIFQNLTLQPLDLQINPLRFNNSLSIIIIFYMTRGLSFKVCLHRGGKGC